MGSLWIGSVEAAKKPWLEYNGIHRVQPSIERHPRQDRHIVQEYCTVLHSVNNSGQLSGQYPSGLRPAESVWKLSQSISCQDFANSNLIKIDSIDVIKNCCHRHTVRSTRHTSAGHQAPMQATRHAALCSACQTGGLRWFRNLEKFGCNRDDPRGAPNWYNSLDINYIVEWGGDACLHDLLAKVREIIEALGAGLNVADRQRYSLDRAETGRGVERDSAVDGDAAGGQMEG